MKMTLTVFCVGFILSEGKYVAQVITIRKIFQGFHIIFGDIPLELETATNPALQVCMGKTTHRPALDSCLDWDGHFKKMLQCIWFYPGWDTDTKSMISRKLDNIQSTSFRICSSYRLNRSLK